MRHWPAALAAAALVVAGCGEDPVVQFNVPDIEVPAETLQRSQPPEAYVKPLGAAVLADRAAADPAYLRAFITHFTSLTPEAAMKWQVIHPERDEYNFDEADELMELARTTGKQVRGHPLVWDEQLPGWLTDTDWEADELEDVLRDHVTEVVGRYRGRVAEWDVVNEPFDDDGKLTRHLFYETLGERYIDIAFHAARRADPAAKLFINEYGAETPTPKAFGMLALVKRLQERGVPLDGIGFQNHTGSAGYPTRDELLATFSAYSKLGLATPITEMDAPLSAAAGLAEQAAAYGAAADACVAAANCTSFTVWGATDRYSWRGPNRRPLLFDDSGAPKPALAAVTQRFLR